MCLPVDDEIADEIYGAGSTHCSANRWTGKNRTLQHADPAAEIAQVAWRTLTEGRKTVATGCASNGGLVFNGESPYISND